uniref:Solute carrier family 25 member 28 n=1 Tax=Gadus morhua TaxID=8049 RepID=A0A8C5F7G5_GADMO
MPMEVEGFIRKRRMTAETSGNESGVAGASAGAEVRWLGGRFWGLSESIMGTLTPRVGGELDLQTVHYCCGSPDLTEDSDADYEGLPQGASTSTHMLAGAVAGIMEHCLMFPIDCVKTRMQSLQPDPAAHYRNVMDALRRIITTEGVWRPMRGLNATAVGAGPAHALYFACYEKLKKTLSDRIHPGANSHLANGAAGCVATLLHDAAMNPAEVVKQRMQMYNSPYRGVLDCVRAVWRTEGGGAFYRSYTTQLTMNVPFQALHFMTYEYLQEQLNPHRQYNPSSHVVSARAPPPTDRSRGWPTPSGRCTGWAACGASSGARRPASSTRCPPRPSAGRCTSSSSTASPSASTGAGCSTARPRDRTRKPAFRAGETGCGAAFIYQPLQSLQTAVRRERLVACVFTRYGSAQGLQDRRGHGALGSFPISYMEIL